MSRLELHYSGSIVGYALVDDEIDPLGEYCTVLCAIPRRLYTLADNRPDIILSNLREDEYMFRKVRPFVKFMERHIYLVHIALRNELLEIIARRRLGIGSKDPEVDILLDINRICASIGRVAYVSGDRTDCRTCNLREIMPEEDYVS